MNKIYLSFGLLFLLVSVHAQYVLIPDSNFRHALITNGYASCFDITQTMLDTTCSAVLDSTSLTIDQSNITSIEGVQYFKHLAKLDCSNNNLTALPQLPDSLLQLICGFNNITVLQTLPNSLTYLDITHDHTTIILALPSSLQYFNCVDNPIDSFPTLPNQLNSFSGGAYPIHHFPALPNSLRTFQFVTASLDSLPTLPDSLEILVCEANNLTFLPALPTTLRDLNCSNNKLTSIPALPSSLIDLICTYNQLTSLPSLNPYMEYISCGYNSGLSCLPTLDTISTLNFDSTAITCVPDTGIIHSSSPLIGSLPLCGANGCTATGIFEPTFGNTCLKIYPNPAANTLHIEYTPQNAIFTITDITGKISVVSPNGNELDISNLSPGMYCLQIKTVGANAIGKFIKE